VKSLISLWSCMAQELAIRCCTSATRDVKTVASRCEHEGLWFLAVTLADLGKVIQKWLDQGFVGPASDAPKFKWDNVRGRPRFLGGFLDRVFVPGSGVLLDEPDIEAIYALRQLTLAFGKIALPTSGNGQSRVVTPEREALAMSEFVQCEQDVKVSDSLLDPSYREDFVRISEMLYGDVFTKLERDLQYGRCIPKHGPGAVADKLTSNGKWNQRTWTARLQKHFAPEEFLIANCKPERVAQLRKELDILEPGSEIPVRVISVPKTLKTPRIIAIEPAAMQYVQQSLLRNFLSAFKEDDFLSHAIGIDDQVPNQELARRGSLSGDLATLDLSEASDRVSNQHVLALMEGWPLLSEAVQSARSRKADVQGHGVIRLAKYASMGSALTFPIEAMVFLTVILLGIERELSAPLTREKAVSLLSGRVRVFGDDLIVPRDYVLSVCDELSVFGHKVNINKSFWTGRFRESCGKEYYSGEDVSIVRIRQVLPLTRQDANGVIATVALRNQAYWSGLWKTAAWLDNYIRGVIKHFPNVAPTSPVLGRESALGYEFQGLNPRTHSPFIKGYYVRARPPRDILEGEGALLKCLTRKATPEPYSMVMDDATLFSDAIVDTEHLERSGRPQRVDIKLGRKSPF
jgi:hypothetical protein